MAGCFSVDLLLTRVTPLPMTLPLLVFILDIMVMFSIFLHIFISGMVRLGAHPFRILMIDTSSSLSESGLQRVGIIIEVPLE